MRQSASVITLLVGSAAAADYPLGGSGGTQVAAGYGAGYYTGSTTGTKVQNALLYSDPGAYTNLANRQAAYAPYRTLGSIAYTSSAAVAQAYKVSASITEPNLYSATGAALGGGSGCPQCILGGGVWCSATYAY